MILEIFCFKINNQKTKRKYTLYIDPNIPGEIEKTNVMPAFWSRDLPPDITVQHCDH